MSETICAIASGGVNAGVGIVRISGNKCIEIAEKIVQKTLTPRYAHYGNFYAGSEVIDQGIALFFPSPHSFTGEDVLELQCHGGPAIMRLILEVVLDCGAVIATAGEFSKRAFLNGKMDLVQAEAIADMIETHSSRAAKLALNSLRGEFSKKINYLRTQMIEIRTFVEATIDFVDEEIDFITDHNIQQKIEKIIHTLEDILTTSTAGAVLQTGINIAIMGKPNAGKSSLLNALTLEDSAIVADVAGTTRDIIKEQIIIDGLTINLVDTAGIRKSRDTLENIGIKRAKDASKKADIVLLVFVSGEMPDLKLLQGNSSYILVQNKIDLYPKPYQNTLKNTISISAKLGTGIDELKKRIITLAGINDLSETTTLARMRHVTELQASLTHMQRGLKNLTELSIELVADDLNSASNHLGRITGEFNSDDLLGEIFSNFCIGK